MLKLSLSIFFSIFSIAHFMLHFWKSSEKGMFTTAEKGELEFMLCLGYP